MVAGGPTAALAPFSPSFHATPALSWTPLTIGSITATPSPAYVGNATTISTTASGGNTSHPYTYAYSGLPAGCVSADAASISCTPTSSGTVTIVVRVNDSGGNVTSNAIQLSVLPFTITSFSVTPSPDALGTSVTFQATYAGANGSLTWVWSGLPAGCTAPVNAKTLACTPTSAGTSSVSLKGTDSTLPTGKSSTASTSLTVTPVSITSFVDSPSVVYLGRGMNFTVSITGTTGFVTYSYAGLPIGCASANVSRLSCVARFPGSYTVTVTVRDSAGDSSSRAAFLTVNPLTIISFTESPSPTYQFLPTTFTVSAAGWLGPVQAGVGTAGYPVYSYAGLPAGCVSKNVSRFTCSPTARGTFIVNATVSDPTGNHTSKLVTVTVDPSAEPSFYVAVNTNFADQKVTNQGCYTVNNAPFYSSTCSSQEQDPSIVTLPGGVTGVGYAVYTNSTNSTCLGHPAGFAAANTNSRVAFSLSTTNGTNFTSTVLLGDTTCTYLNAIEPAFGASAGGNVYGVFIMENATVTTLPSQYGVRTGDALGFVVSRNGGVTFSTVRSIDASGNLALPAIAVVGGTIYVVYEMIQNSSTPISGGVLPIALKYTWSSDGGNTWQPAVTLPGLNASEGYTAMNPSIAVSSTGEVGISYATDRSCIAWSGAPYKSPCLHYGDQIVVVTSISNGTSWTGPTVVSGSIPSGVTPTSTTIVGSFLGETTCQSGGCFAYYFQSLPDTSIAFNGAGSKLYVAWSGTINGSVQPNSNSWWRWTAVGASSALALGGTWTSQIVAAPDNGAFALGLGNTTNYYRPAIGVWGSQLYVTYSADNETSPTYKYKGPFDNTLSQWGDNATLPALGNPVWWHATPISYVQVPAGRLTNFTGNSFTGFHSAVGFTATGGLLFGFSIAKLPTVHVVSRTGYYTVNTTYSTNLTIAQPALPGMPEVVGVTFTETGLPPGSNWQFILDNQVITAVNTSSLLVVNVPKGLPVFQSIVPRTPTYGELITNPTIPAIVTYNFPTTYNLAYSLLLAVNQTFGPTPTVSGCPANNYCDYEFYFYSYVYQCLSGPFCTPTQNNTYCNYFSAGCYYMYWDEELFHEVGPGNYNYWDVYNYFQLHALAFASSGYTLSVNTNCFGPTCGSTPLGNVWLPESFHLSAWDNSYEYGFSGLSQYVTFGNGTGRGSYNGAAQICPGSDVLNFVYCQMVDYNFLEYCGLSYQYGWCHYVPYTVYAPINETIWNLPSSFGGGANTYPMEIYSQGLPAGTSYSFEFNGVNETAVSPNGVYLPNVPQGNSSITEAVATGATPGWEYFAADMTVSAPDQAVVNLTFTTYVDVGAPSRTVSFHALNLTTGTIWRAEVNGTIYTATTPYLNLSLRPGNYSLMTWGVTNPTGDATYSPIFSPAVSLISSTSYAISFVPSYKVSLTSSIGGTITLARHPARTADSAWYAPGSVVNITATPAPGYLFIGWTGSSSSPGAYTGTSKTPPGITVQSPIYESAAFAPLPQARFNLTFVSQNLPSGVWWTVYLNGVGYSTNASSLTVPNVYSFSTAGGLGLYRTSVGFAYFNTTNNTRFIPGGLPAVVSTNGSSTGAYPITWTPQYQVTLESTPGGTVSAQAGTLQYTTGTFWAQNAQTIGLQAVADSATSSGTYVFLGWNGTGVGSVTTNAAATPLVVGGPITEIAQFAFVPNPPPNRYTVEFVFSTPVASGTSWTVTLNGTSYSSTNTTLFATGVLGGSAEKLTVKTAYSPTGTTRYVPVSSTPATVAVPGSGTYRISFDTQYWVQISSSSGGSVAVQGPTGGAVNPTGWFKAGSQLVLNATSLGSWLFQSWNGTGTGSSTTGQPTTTIQVNGPITEIAEFQAPLPPTKTVGGVFSSTPVWGILAAVGLLAGLGLGMVMFRRRKGGSGGRGSMEEAEEAPSSEPSSFAENPGGDQ